MNSGPVFISGQIAYHSWMHAILGMLNFAKDFTVKFPDRIRRIGRESFLRLLLCEHYHQCDQIYCSFRRQMKVCSSLTLKVPSAAYFTVCIMTLQYAASARESILAQPTFFAIVGSQERERERALSLLAFLALNAVSLVKIARQRHRGDSGRRKASELGFQKSICERYCP